MKFKSIRLLIDNLNSIIHGWYFHFATKKIVKEQSQSWVCIAEFDTKIKWREELGKINRNRIDNMKICCEQINNLRLKPGDVFSLKRVIGNPSAERGYKSGPMIVNGQMGFTPGGGLCQVSTTLFNTALLGNMIILQKYNHSRDIWGEDRFIDLGRDAIYVYARKDLKFKNNHRDQVAINIQVLDNERLLRCRLLSPKPLLKEITIQTDIIKELMPQVNQLSYEKFKPIKGWVVLTTRKATKNGRTQITYRRKERYQPGIISVSTKDN